MISECNSSWKAHLAVVLVLSFLISCRTVEKIPVAKIKPIGSIRLYKNAEANSFDYQQFRINRINIQLNKNENRTSFRASIHALKDKSVLISITKLNILLARVMLTPDSVFYVNYFEKVYYRGDYEPIRNLLNFDINFNTIQAIVSADIFSLFDKKKDLREYKTWIEDGKYALQSETFWKLSRMEEKGKTQRVEKILKRIDEDISVVQTFYFDPVTFLVQDVVMEDKTSQRMAKLIFRDYEQVGVKYFPASVDMIYNSGEDDIQLFSKLSGFSTEDGEFVPLRIPEKFQRVYLN
jgi:hypothetical protein